MTKDLKGPILVTGASGFIGAVLVRRLVAAGRADVHVLLRDTAKTWRLEDILPKLHVHRVDVTDRAGVLACVQEVKPRTIFHLAVYGAYPAQKDVALIEATALHGTMNLLDAAETVGFDAFINVGSSSEYGFKNAPMKETDVLEPNSHYAVFKAAATNYCAYEAVSKKLPVITVRPFSVYGPYEEPTRLVPTLLGQLLQGTLPPLASPDIARDYIYVDDFVDACLVATTHPEFGGQIFNAGSGRQTTLKEIVDLAISLVGASVTPEWGTMGARIWDQKVWVADVSKAKEKLGWEPRTDLATGLTQTIAWLKANPKQL
jgi:nucleoside-diphosphate-sugar epimerase